ncbi:FecR domain-containing protein [Pseudomonas fluorescens]|jgi:transmembrane sensor|uniref:FecR domain-containing protein n=1 Tax=Pseudomonas TaxID=286 RepID=UPI00025E93AE|nr:MULTISPECIES: FecR domain-containing protein [Pseudomonas]AFJ56081.1 sigma factor regulatory protein FecR [Pseudomonas fluorescens A506]MBD8257243.1 FecR domain-containing protein [Pseudomonas fluorescens]MBH3399702.1 FecR domain-containing protein [Pseudomonas fluorescens]MBK3429590.1 FecR domain-containing protein [Pseudomonas fluorescens]MBK3480451.1 FecR domain-containing protein [Pseudomonas fluorescens]
MNVSSQVAEQAVHWLLEMQQGTLNPRQQAAWQQWLNAHSEHQRAWEQIQSVNQRLRGVPPPLAHAALNAPTSRSRRQALKLLLIVGAGSAAAWSLRQQHILPPLTADYRSPVGQRRTVQLADGSQLQLNTGSAVDVHFDGQQRLVRLLEGEILLTARAGQTPLHVLTGQGLLSSQAARLTVRQFNDHTQLAVLAGQVEVMPNRYNGLALRVDAAQQVNFTRKGWDTPRPTDANSGAWADGMLVAAHMRLEDFLNELGRYRRGQLQCDPHVANLLLSGSYPLDDSERILDLLEISLPVKVRRFTRYWVTVQARV